MAKHRVEAEHRSSTAENSRLGTNILWNYVSGLTSLFGLLLLYPLAIHIVGSESYGLWVLAIGAVQLLTMSDFGLGTGVVRLLNEIDEFDQVARRRFIVTAVRVFILPATVVTTLYTLAFPLYLHFVDIPDGNRHAVVPIVILAGLTLFISILGRAFNSVLWAENRPDIERKAAVVAIVLRALGYVILLILHEGLLGIVVVECLSLALPSVVCMVVVNRRYSALGRVRGSWSECGKPLLRMSSVLSIGSLSQLGVYQLPLFIVAPALGLHAATAFGALMRVYQSCRLVVSWTALPFLYPIKRAERGQVAAQVKNRLNLTLTMAMLMSIPLLALPTELLEFWLGSEFMFVATALAVVSLGVVAEALTQPADMVMTLRGSPLVASLLRLTTFILTVPAVALAVRSNSLESVMIATVGPSLLIAILQVAFASRVVPFRPSRCDWLRWGNALVASAACVAIFVGMAQLLPSRPSVLASALVLGAVAVRIIQRVRRMAE